MPNVNGKYYDWGDVIVELPYGPQVEAVTITYDDAMAKEHIHGQGVVPRGYGKGKWSASGTLTLKKEGYNSLTAYALALGKSFYSLIFPITVFYANLAEAMPPTVDKLIGCTFTERSFSAGEDDTSFDVEVSFMIISDIVSNGVSAHGGNLI